MSKIILHGYSESLFSEKIRLLLGYKQSSYASVQISPIMPRPDLMPMTGGYRRVPVMQIGADIYCDTVIIARVIDELFDGETIFPADSVAAQSAMAYWTDTFLFKACVALVFQPSAAAQSSLLQDEATAAAFMADRAELTKGAASLNLPLAIAETHFLAHLNALDIQLGGDNDFLFGSTPGIADFSTYHCCWFVHNVEVLQDLFSPFVNLLSWFERMSAFGHGDVEQMSSHAALEIAKNTNPVEMADAVFLEDLDPGQLVDVMPIDYGFQPVRGELLTASFDEIAVARTDAVAGKIVVHFPRTGFQINSV